MRQMKSQPGAPEPAADEEAEEEEEEVQAEPLHFEVRRLNFTSYICEKFPYQQIL